MWRSGDSGESLNPSGLQEVSDLGSSRNARGLKGSGKVAGVCNGATKCIIMPYTVSSFLFKFVLNVPSDPHRCFLFD